MGFDRSRRDIHPVAALVIGVLLAGFAFVGGIGSLIQLSPWSQPPVRVTLDDPGLERFKGRPVRVVAAQCLQRKVPPKQHGPYSGGARLMRGVGSGIVAVVACGGCVGGRVCEVVGVLQPIAADDLRYLRSIGFSDLDLRFSICIFCTRENAIGGVIAGALFTLAGAFMAGAAIFKWRQLLRRKQ